MNGVLFTRAGVVGGGLLVLALLGGCTSDGAERGASPSSPPADLLPDDDRPVATDAPRPPGTDVVVSFAGWDEETASVEVAGYVSPVVEAGGECTAELSRSGRTVRATAAAEPDASTTVCAGLAVAAADLTPGTWTVTLSYASGSTSGVSEAVDVEVPE